MDNELDLLFHWNVSCLLFIIREYKDCCTSIVEITRPTLVCFSSSRRNDHGDKTVRITVTSN